MEDKEEGKPAGGGYDYKSKADSDDSMFIGGVSLIVLIFFICMLTADNVDMAHMPMNYFVNMCELSDGSAFVSYAEVSYSIFG